MIKKRWKRVVLTLGLMLATAHLYLTLFAVQKNTYVHGGRRLDAFNVRSTASAHLSNFSKITPKINRGVPMETNSIFYEVNRERTRRRNPSTSVTPATVREREDNGTLFYGRGGGEVPADRSNSTQILIVAYIRSGSSLTGDILQQDPDSFYVYEPLHFTEKNGAKIHRVQLLNGEVVDIGRKHFFDRAFTVINSYFDCDFARLDFGTLVHGFQTFGNKTNKFIKCYVNKTGQKIQKKLAAQICGVQLQDSCQRSKFRTIKTIRIPMMHVETLLQRYPNLKVIHLVRDPRAQVNSIDLLAKTTKYNKGFARQKCTAMNKDFYFSEQYRSRYPGRIMRLYYEDLASNPIKTSRSLYDFTGMNFSSTVRDYISGITSTGRDGCAICSRRANSSEHVEKWRLNLKYSEVKLIDKQCQETYEHYGFLPARSKAELRDLTIPLRLPRREMEAS